MEGVLAGLIGLVFAASIYLMLSGVLVKFVFGFALASNAVNLLIFTAGRSNMTGRP
jgi:multicomponent Na+:H+ antiporter subunit C